MHCSFLPLLSILRERKRTIGCEYCVLYLREERNFRQFPGSIRCGYRRLRIPIRLQQTKTRRGKNVVSTDAGRAPLHQQSRPRDQRFPWTICTYRDLSLSPRRGAEQGVITLETEQSGDAVNAPSIMAFLQSPGHDRGASIRLEQDKPAGKG